MRIVLFGATGYTGRLTAEALARRVPKGVTTVLAGRDAGRLAEVAADVGDGTDLALDTRVADAADESQVRALVDAGDVLISTVGPFVRLGMPAARAAAGKGITYLDSTGEPAFVRRVRDELGAAALRSGATLVPAFGYDYVPGNLAAELALRDAPEATRMRVGYFVAGRGQMSGGTSASGAGMLLDPAYAWRGGQLVGDQMASRVTTFRVGGRSREAVSLAGSEHLWLPPRHPALTDVEVFLGWAGSRSRGVQATGLVLRAIASLPGGRTVVDAVTSRSVKGSTGGPDAAARAAAKTRVVAEAFTSYGHGIARVQLDGPNPYELTAELLAWAAVEATAYPPGARGVVGPADLFGLDALEAAARDMGLAPV